MSLLRLSFDVSAVPASPAGAGRYVVELHRALSDRDDVEMVVWCRRNDERRWHPRQTGSVAERGHPRVHSSAPPARPLRLLWEQLRLPSLIERSGAEVHHSPHYTMPEHSKLPVVVTIHDLTFLDRPEWHESGKRLVFRRAIRLAAERAGALVCVSQRTADRLRELLEPAGRIFVVPHGIDHSSFGPEDPGTDATIMAGLGVRPPYVLFVGTVEPRKGLPELVRAFDRLAEPELRLVLAGGGGWGREELAGALASIKRPSRVQRLGYVRDGAVPALIRNAALVAYPAYEEGFGLPALEALACGTPLVTTAGTAMADLAGGSAWLVPAGSSELLADAMEGVLAGGADVSDRRERGLAVARAHTWAACAEGHMAAYRFARDRGWARSAG